MSLLETPIHILMESLEKDKGKETLSEDAFIHQAATGLGTVASSDGRAKEMKRSKSRPMDTWTDRYKPKQFTELLGDEVSYNSACFSWNACLFSGDL